MLYLYALSNYIVNPQLSGIMYLRNLDFFSGWLYPSVCYDAFFATSSLNFAAQGLIAVPVHVV